MRKIVMLCALCLTIVSLFAQKTNGKIDAITGKKILDSLPANMQGKNLNTKNDKVWSPSGFIGVVVHRDYGTENKVTLEVINQSPSANKVSTIIAQPVSNANYTITQINGYKALVQTLKSEINKTGYELLLPINATLVTLRAFGYTQDQFLTMANNIPVAMIAQKVK